MQARIFNLNATDSAVVAAGRAIAADSALAGFQHLSTSRANLILYNSAADETPAAADGEAIACRSLKYQVADLWSALLTAETATAAACIPAAENVTTADLAAQLDSLEADINGHCRSHTLLAHWPELDDRANQLADDIGRLALTHGTQLSHQLRTNNI